MFAHYDDFLIACWPVGCVISTCLILADVNVAVILFGLSHCLVAILQSFPRIYCLLTKCCCHFKLLHAVRYGAGISAFYSLAKNTAVILINCLLVKMLQSFQLNHFLLAKNVAVISTYCMLARMLQSYQLTACWQTCCSHFSLLLAGKKYHML